MQPKLLVIAGPTASGKTALALEVARRTGAEIVSADSQQVYARFDIGTAKPSPEELAAVPHHLISVVDPTEQFSAGRYQSLADAAIADIHARGKRVVVVGGTGMYIRMLLHGLVDAPRAEPALRARLEAEANAKGRAALHARLAAIDPESAARIHPADLVRIIRALEIHALTGAKASQRRDTHAFGQQRYPHELFVIAIDRDTLYERIDRRTEAMFAGGLVEEVRGLIEAGLRDAPAMHSVGYAQAAAYLEGRLSYAEAIAAAARETRRYAKRQLTWFKKETGAQYVTPDELLRRATEALTGRSADSPQGD